MIKIELTNNETSRLIVELVRIATSKKFERRCAKHNWYWPYTSYSGDKDRFRRAGYIEERRNNGKTVFYGLTEKGIRFVKDLHPVNDAQQFYPEEEDIRDAYTRLYEYAIENSESKEQAKVEIYDYYCHIGEAEGHDLHWLELLDYLNDKIPSRRAWFIELESEYEDDPASIYEDV
jgi:hypothetical protein